MKRTIIVFSLIATTIISNAQSTDWTKDDRNNVFEECLATLTKYKDITHEQKESISLCYLDEVTKKYTKKEYQTKIDIEIRRIQEATILQCSKNIGVELNVKKEEQAVVAKLDSVAITKQVNEGNFTREDLIGSWRDNNSRMFFNKDASFIAKMDDGTSFGATWWIDEAKNIVVSNYGTLTVLSFDGNTLKYQETVIVKKNLFGKILKTKTAISTAEKIK